MMCYNQTIKTICKTAVYGSYDCPQVWTLRRFRDNTLASTWFGRLFIRTYYAVSPLLVRWFGHQQWFRKLWRGPLDRMVAGLQAKGVESAELLTAGATADTVDPTTEERVIEVKNLTREFNIRGSRGDKKTLKAVDDVSFYVRKGTTTALVGESGSGKSTVANMVLSLLEPTSGQVLYNGTDLSTLSRRDLFNMRRKLQVVFQNPYGSLDPMYRQWWNEAETDAGRQRVVVDQIASMTESRLERLAKRSAGLAVFMG